MDQLIFKFDGSLAATNRMDFYEIARFQYAASRLAVKLDQFRRTGSFSKKITNTEKTDVTVRAFNAGSFNVIVESDRTPPSDLYINAPLTAFSIYLAERVFNQTDISIAIDMIDSVALKSDFTQLIEGELFRSDQAIELLQSRMSDFAGFGDGARLLIDRLNAEAARRAYLEAHRDLFESILPEDDAALVTMAAPS